MALDTQPASGPNPSPSADAWFLAGVSQPTILMCPPEFFAVAYVINPWMSSEPVNNDEARRQWDKLYATITQQLGAQVVLINPEYHVPDLVFTANAAFVHGNKAVIAHFKHPERQLEEPIYERWFRTHGYDVALCEPGVHFEGAGDALTWQGQVFAGYKTRTDIRSHERISQHTSLPVVSMELVSDHFYHIDVCLCPLDTGHLIYSPQAFDEYGLSVIEQTVPEDLRIPVSQEDARRFACNAVNIGDQVIFNQGSTALVEVLKAKGIRPIELDLSEFIKSGGSCKCLTLRLN